MLSRKFNLFLKCTLKGVYPFSAAIRYSRRLVPYIARIRNIKHSNDIGKCGSVRRLTPYNIVHVHVHSSVCVCTCILVRIRGIIRHWQNCNVISLLKNSDLVCTLLMILDLFYLLVFCISFVLSFCCGTVL